MREIDVKELTSCIKQLCIQANKELPCSVKKSNFQSERTGMQRNM